MDFRVQNTATWSENHTGVIFRRKIEFIAENQNFNNPFNPLSLRGKHCWPTHTHASGRFLDSRRGELPIFMHNREMKNILFA